MIDKSLKLKTVSNTDYDALIEFLSNFEDENRGPKFWRSRLYFWWDQNPAFSDEIERGWILTRNDNDKIVGFIGNIPSFFHFQREKIIVYNATTWRVKRKYRNQSLLLLFKSVSYSKNSISFDTTPSDDVVNILKALNYQQFPVLTKWTYFNLLNSYNVFRARISTSNFLFILTKPALQILRYYQSIRLMNMDRVNTVKRITKAGSKFDSLWEKSKNKYANTNVRTSDVINWYCFGDINFEKILLGYFHNDELQAYAIYNIILSDNKLKQLFCTDLWGININKKIVRSFCAAAMKYANDNKIDIIRYPHFDNHLGNIYCRLGLFRHKVIDNRYINTSAEKLKALNDTETYLTYFQGDFGL